MARSTLFLALNYGGRAEILDAAGALPRAAERTRGGGACTRRDMHDPDLIIRTGGDRRLSNFLLWQAAYSELVFRDEYWPEFSRGAFEESLYEVGQRGRALRRTWAARASVVNRRLAGRSATGRPISAGHRQVYARELDQTRTAQPIRPAWHRV